MRSHHTRQAFAWPLVAALVLAALAWPAQTAQAHSTGLATPPLPGTAQTTPFAPTVSFAMPGDDWKPRFSTLQDEYEPVPLIIPWLLFGITGANPPFTDTTQAGILVEAGVEIGTPLYHVGGFFPMITIAPAIGGQTFRNEFGTDGSFHFAINSLMGFALSNASGTDIFQFGLKLRGEIAFRRMRYSSGENYLGVDGLAAFNVGMFMRYSFLFPGWELAGSAALFVTFDVADGGRQWLVGVDFGGLIIAAWLGLFR